MIQNREKLNPKIVDILAELKQILQNIYGDSLKELILYGSYARGEEKTHSDIDVVIILKTMENPYEELKRINEATYKLIIKYGLVLNFHPITEEKFNQKNLSFYNAIKTEGIKV